MGLSKRLIMTITALQSVLMIAIFIFASTGGSSQLVVPELLFFAFASAIAAFSINILIIVLVKMVKDSIKSKK